MTRVNAAQSRASLKATSYARRLEIQRTRRHIQTILLLKVRPSDNDPKLNSQVARIARIYQTKP